VSDDDNDDDEEDEEDEQEEWDPSEERLPGEKRNQGKGKGKETAAGAGGEGGGEGKAHPWQAVWSAEKNGEWTGSLRSSLYCHCLLSSDGRARVKRSETKRNEFQ
jgi:hypothetical protein